jgi:Epoxide hydrolase N terminus
MADLPNPGGEHDVTNATRAQQRTGTEMTEFRRFHVEITDAAIDDLRDRLARTRWPEKEPVSDWSMGIPLAYVQELAEYWESPTTCSASPIG